MNHAGFMHLALASAMRNFLPQVRQPHIGFLWNLYAWNMIAGTGEHKHKQYSGASSAAAIAHREPTYFLLPPERLFMERILLILVVWPGTHYGVSNEAHDPGNSSHGFDRWFAYS